MLLKPGGPKRDCYARGLGFDSQVEQKVLLGFSMKFSVVARSLDLCPVIMAIGSPPITWDLNIPANCGCTLVHLCLTLRGIQA